MTADISVGARYQQEPRDLFMAVLASKHQACEPNGGVHCIQVTASKNQQSCQLNVPMHAMQPLTVNDLELNAFTLADEDNKMDASSCEPAIVAVINAEPPASAVTSAPDATSARTTSTSPALTAWLIADTPSRSRKSGSARAANSKSVCTVRPPKTASSNASLTTLEGLELARMRMHSELPAVVASASAPYMEHCDAVAGRDVLH
eukprot:CAMPEP_0204334254 /NCGR_PEP_ID=MMETSP0469-20131031/17885_1 /ASSEMBLY_ACC=CAM_ASM_000384 /TAXON_ID=2969 /ORGANISM="Oxyrrhis marina" /LENGTH=204 /DNA_ID=CAMNT_0051317749 /DNA_START=36 /DNA_END=648 /DNA_ORIENTATION=+